MGSELLAMTIARGVDIDFQTSTVTAQSKIGGISTNDNGNQGGRCNLYCYGAVPTSRKTTLNGNVANGASSFVTTDATGWVNGDIIGVGRAAAGGASRAYYTVSSTSGTTVNITGTISGARTSGGQVVKLSGYAIKFIHLTSYTAINNNFINLVMVGVEYPFRSAINFLIDANSNLMTISSTNSFAYYTEAASNIYCESYIEDCSFYGGVTSAVTSGIAFLGLTVRQSGLRIERCHFHNSRFMNGWYAFNNSYMTSGRLKIIDCVMMNIAIGATGQFTDLTYPTATGVMTFGKITFTGNVMESSEHGFVTFGGTDLIHKNNSYWGGGATVSAGGEGAVVYAQLAGTPDISANTYNANRYAVHLHAFVTVGQIEKNSVFGNVSANTLADIIINAGALADFEFSNCSTITTVNTDDLANTINGSYIKYTTLNGTTNNDGGYLTYGKFQRTGTGLSDTTVHTAGGTALRFEPLSSTTNLSWSFVIPTGNIQNKTMMVGVWCKIASATYFAGTHQLPRLTIDYDNGTAAYVQASATAGSWQFLPLPFTPLTTYGQITVTLSARTDATTTNAYVYFDDFVTIYPADTPLNTQTLDLWASALPVVPPLATVLSANDIWAASRSANMGSGTMGEWLGKKALTVSKFLGLK
jgi:hypothetical protein